MTNARIGLVVLSILWIAAFFFMVLATDGKIGEDWIGGAGLLMTFAMFANMVLTYNHAMRLGRRASGWAFGTFIFPFFVPILLAFLPTAKREAPPPKSIWEIISNISTRENRYMAALFFMASLYLILLFIQPHPDESPALLVSTLLIHIAIFVVVIRYAILLNRVDTFGKYTSLLITMISFVFPPAGLSIFLLGRRRQRKARIKQVHFTGDGMVRCSKCGTTYRVNITLGAPNEVQVLNCTVCPVNAVFAVCERCADLSQFQKEPCPSCGASHLWQITGMSPA